MKNRKLLMVFFCSFSSLLVAQSLEKTAESLIKRGIVKFGAFTLKGGTQSPVYINLRSVISHPGLLENVAHH